MSRYGGAATVGRMWTEDVDKAYDDPYGAPPQQKKTSTGQKVAIGGALTTALGVKHYSDANRLPEMVQSRLQTAESRHHAAGERVSRANDRLNAVRTDRDLAPRGGKWVHRGRLRRATRQAEWAQRDYDQTDRTLKLNQKYGTKKQVKIRQKRMKGGGAALTAAGTAVMAAPAVVGALKRKKAASFEEASKSLSQVSKTITQARYGANAEMGRAWRGEEKKDTSLGTVAAGSLGVGAAGGATAIAAHRRKPEHMADRTKELKRTADKTVNTAVKRASSANRAFSHYVAGMEFENRAIHAPDKAARDAALLKVRRVRAAQGAKGKVFNSPTKKGRDAGRYAASLSHELEANAQRKLERMNEAVREAKAARKEYKGHGAARQANKLSRIRHTNVTRAGTAVAALGGAGALAAGIKAERDRNTGWSKPVRKNALTQEVAAARAVRNVTLPKAKQQRLRNWVGPSKSGRAALRRSHDEAAAANAVQRAATDRWAQAGHWGGRTW